MTYDDSLYHSLLLVQGLQREIDICRQQLDSILLNLTCDSYQASVRNDRYHPCFREVHSFFSFLHKNHPEILEEWRKTNNETK